MFITILNLIIIIYLIQFYIDLSKKKYKTKKCYTNNSHVHGNSPVNYLINELIIYKKIKLKLKIS